MMAVPSFQGYVQHDAHEFLTELLDVVQRDIAYPVEVRTILSRVFTSVQQSATRCHVCNNVSKYTFPDATCITLDLSATVERYTSVAERRRARDTTLAQASTNECRIEWGSTISSSTVVVIRYTESGLHADGLPRRPYRAGRTHERVTVQAWNLHVVLDCQPCQLKCHRTGV